VTGVVLVTGGTGMLGRELVGRLLTDTDAQLALLVRRPQPLVTMLRDVFRVEASDGLRRRVRAVVGDVTRPRLGLSEDDHAWLTARAGSILHAAAETRFDRTLRDARSVNVGGTRNVVAFARHCRQLERLGVLSTVYVSGRRTGTILECERQHRAGFVNSYEQAKYEAEAVVERAADVPWSIYRLSTLVGNADSGYTSRFTTPHHALRMMYLGLASIVSGDPDCPVDLIATDFAAATVATLFMDRFRPHQVFQLVAGAEKSYSLREIIDRSYEHLEAVDPEWGSRPHPRPAIASQAAFELLFQAAEQSRNVLMRQVIGTLRYFAGQFSYPKRFDVAATRAAIPGYEEAVPDIRSYYDKVVRYSVETGWGRRA
jgi:thioester reductase-like protein